MKLASEQNAVAAFLRACELDVAVRKPGNVSAASAGHGMVAAQFVSAARAAAGPLCEPGARVGRRIERAGRASWQAAGCNTNLGILLLCAPIVAAAEAPGALDDGAALQAAIEACLARLDRDDAAGAFAAIAHANPGGLGDAPEQDVHAAPTVGLREAMALAAGRDRIARQYAEGFGEVIAAANELARADRGDAGASEAAVQRAFLGFLASAPDSHIVRKHGAALAHSVMSAAQAWRAIEWPGRDPRFAAWDDSLKAQGLNPGTSADLTVAALFAAGLLAPEAAAWHGT